MKALNKIILKKIVKNDMIQLNILFYYNKIFLYYENFHIFYLEIHFVLCFFMCEILNFFNSLIIH